MTIQLPNSHELSVSLFGFRFCLLCVRFYVNDLICMRSALLALVGVFFFFGLFSVYAFGPGKTNGFGVVHFWLYMVLLHF
jgi:hypothetical protein